MTENTITVQDDTQHNKELDERLVGFSSLPTEGAQSVEHTDEPTDATSNEIRIETLSKTQQKKLAKRQKWLAKKAEIKQQKAELKRKRKKEGEWKEKKPADGITRKQLKKMRTEEFTSNITVAVDLSFDHLMSEGDLRKMAKQFQMCYSRNRRSKRRLQFYFTSFNSRSSKVLLNSTEKGCLNWDVTFKEEDYLEVFDKERVVYLTSDSPNVLETLEDNMVYMIGGLIDHNHQKGLCYRLATEKSVATARLPIDQFINMKTRKVLTINQVFTIMLLVTEGMSWGDALLSVIPERKGATRLEQSSDGDCKEENTDSTGEGDLKLNREETVEQQKDCSTEEQTAMVQENIGESS